jgi:hypothetical protein
MLGLMELHKINQKYQDKIYNSFTNIYRKLTKKPDTLMLKIQHILFLTKPNT